MKYEYDIFISYKRYGEWTQWVCGEFLRLLRFHLANELGRDPKIFVDNQLEAGTDWPKDLALKLTVSRVLVPLFSKMYFGSDWCLRELYAARFKEEQLGLRTACSPSGIIVPARIHDGNEADLPKELHECCQMHMADLRPFAIASLRPSSQKYEAFEEAVKSWVEQSIKPAYDRTAGKEPHDAWLATISNRMYHCPHPACFDNPNLCSLV
jgi:hypothetical protein